MFMPIWLQLVWAIAGSVSALVVTHGQYLRQHKRSRLPKYLTSTTFLVNRFVLALVGGVLSIAFKTTEPLQAFYIGLSAPILIERAMGGKDFPKLEG